MFDGAVIVLSLAPMVASTVANGPSSPWDAISLIITLRIWRVKRIIDGEAGQKTSIKVVLSACETDAFCGATPGNTQSLLTQRATQMHKDRLALKELSDPILSMIIQIIYYSEQYSY